MRKKFKKMTAVVLTAAMAFSVVMPAFAETDIEYHNSLTSENYLTSPYIDELKQSYEEYSGIAYEKGKFVTVSLEDYVCGYNPYEGNFDMYLENNILELDDCITLAEVRLQQEAMQNRINEYAKTNATYSSSTQWYYNCPELFVDNAYGKYDLLGSSIVSGDIVIDEKGSFGLTGHNALVVGHFYSNLLNTYYVRVVEAIADGVCYGILCDERVDDRDSYVYSVNASASNKIAAVNWAQTQLNKDYFINASTDVSSNRSTWYCSLLCYAAYNAQGIQLVNYSSGILMPRTLVQSSYLTEVDIGK